MCTREIARERIKDMEVTEFVQLLSSSDFSKEIAKELEKDGIFIDKNPSLQLIYYLAI